MRLARQVHLDAPGASMRDRCDWLARCILMHHQGATSSVPAPHQVQSDAANGLNAPDAQSRHDSAPGEATKVPGRQATHELAPVALP